MYKMIGDMSFDPEDNTVGVSNAERYPYAVVDDVLADALSQRRTIWVTYTLVGKNLRLQGVHPHCAPVTKGLDKRILFYNSSHPRQRLQFSACKNVRFLLQGNYTSAVIAAIRTDSLLVFRHRNIIERVFFDGDKLMRRVTEG